MALQLNPYAKQTLLWGIRNSLFASTTLTTELRLYPALFPMNTNGFSNIATGHLVSFTLSDASMTVTNQTLRYNQTLNATAVATGTPVWWGIYARGTGGLSARLVCDSIGLNGTASSLILGSLSITSGGTVSLIDLTINIA